MTQSKEKAGNLEVRPPIVVVMGHVDHGKTTLLDYIRKTSIAEREAGGITQSIGAYEVLHNDKKITFIDTPGHEAFSKMRARGATVADIAVLVIAADDGVKDQTKEAIKILKESETPFVVAITKVDKNNADIEKAKSQLMTEGIILEGYGGDVSWQAVNSKSGQGINELLDLILLHAEVEGYTYDPETPATGYVIEAERDNRRGATATLIIKNGTLREGDEIKTPSIKGKVKILENFLGEKVKELKPCAPALIIGLPDLAKAGEKFVTGDLEIAEEKDAAGKIMSEMTPDMLPVVLKADVAGSLEALTQIIEALEIENKKVKIIHASVGEVTDGDVKAVISLKAPIIVFRTKVNKAAESLARAQGVRIFSSEIIYELIKLLEEYFEKEYGKHVVAELEVLKTFGTKEKCQVVGGKVVKGVLKANIPVEIKRGEEVIGTGKILNLQEEKKDVREVCEGNECGMLCEATTEVKPGDHLVMY